MGCSICKEKQDANLAPAMLIRSNTFFSGSPRSFRSEYAVGEILGKGTYATVRSCTNRKSGLKFAVKIVDRKTVSKSSESSFRQEVKIMQMLDHPNIIKCYDFFEEEKYFYLVEEFVDGGELYDRIAAKHVYNEREARDLINILLSTIAYCHNKDIVHRDLKLENLLLAHEGDDAEIKVADWGFATLCESDSLTQVCGSLDYIAPEILQREKYGKAVDMWSVGVVTYMLLGGRPPFQAADETVSVWKIKHCEYEFDKAHWWDVSDEAKDLISHMLVHDSSKRFTAQQALAHPWLHLTDDELEQRVLHATLNNMKDSVSRSASFRSTTDTVLSIHRLHKAINASGRSSGNNSGRTSAINSVVQSRANSFTGENISNPESSVLSPLVVEGAKEVTKNSLAAMSSNNDSVTSILDMSIHVEPC